MAKKTTKRVAEATPVPDSLGYGAENDAAAEEGGTIGEPPFTVPGAPRPAAKSLNRSMLWLYGAMGVGKTVLANQFPGPWFFATEQGQDWITTREPTVIHSWDHFLRTCGEIEERKPTKFGDGKPITHIVIDTVDLLWKMCQDEVCGGLGIEDPGELGHGKAWSRLNNEWTRVLAKVRRWPFGLILISHERQKEFKSKGRTTNRWEPEIGAGGLRISGAAADFIFRCYVEEEAEKREDGTLTGDIVEKRLLQCHPSASALAKCRDQRNIPPVLPMDYKSLIAALR